MKSDSRPLCFTGAPPDGSHAPLSSAVSGYLAERVSTIRGYVTDERDRLSSLPQGIQDGRSRLWPAILDDSSVERLIPAIQEAIAAAAPMIETSNLDCAVAAPDVANALAIALATVLVSSPACATPQGTRKLADSAGRELHRLMRDTQRLQDAAAATMKTLQ